MLSPVRGAFTMPPPGSLLPKVLIAILTIAVFYQLPLYQSTPNIAANNPVPTTLSDSTEGTWFQDAIKAHQVEDDDDDDDDGPTYFADVTSSKAKPTPTPTPTPTPSPVPELPVIGDVDNGFDFNRTFISYGTTQCMPAFDDKMVDLARERNQSCTAHSPFVAHETRRVAFASITTGQPEEAYQRAILSQMFHSAVHGSSTHILCEQLSDGAWNKIAFLLNLVMNEMLKPADERLEWVMWIDRDAIVLDACRPLSHFLPPNTADFDKIHMLTNNDAFGLNAGVFIFRVSDWSIDLFNTVLAFRYFRPDEPLVLAEQTALEKIIHEDKYKDAVVRVPWYWFNAYPDEDKSVEKYRDGLEPEDLEWFRARKGDFVVHFAGDDGRSGRMPDWLDMLSDIGNVWEKGETQRDVTAEIEAYWQSWKSGSLTDNQISGEPTKDEGNEA